MTRKDNLPIATSTADITIASGATTSGSVDLYSMNVVGIVMPAAFTGSTLDIQGSLDDSTFYNIYNTDGTQLQLTVGTTRIIALVPSDLAAIRYIRLVSASTEGADRDMTLIVRQLT